LQLFEQELNWIEGLNVLHLRPGYFMENTFAQAGLIQSFGMTAGPLDPDLKLPMIATRDIGAVAAEAMLKRDFSGQQTRELLGQRDLTMNEATRIIARAIGADKLEYHRASDEQVRQSLLQLGMSANMAELLLEMSASLNSGYMRALEQRSARNTTPTSFEVFVAEEFVPLYQKHRAAA
jgi:nucleoside-diphosphate-sugar epimerase